MRTIAEVLRAADQWAAEPATVEDVLDAQRWARERAHKGAGVTGRSSAPHMMMFVIGIVFFALGHPGVGGAARMRAHVGGAGHRDEGAPLLRRLRPHGVVDRRPNRLGYTEYGVKAVPLGGFCDIAGMTSIDEIAPEDRAYAMYRQKTWKRVRCCSPDPR